MSAAGRSPSAARQDAKSAHLLHLSAADGHPPCREHRQIRSLFRARAQEHSQHPADWRHSWTRVRRCVAAARQSSRSPGTRRGRSAGIRAETPRYHGPLIARSPGTNSQDDRQCTGHAVYPGSLRSWRRRCPKARYRQADSRRASTGNRCRPAARFRRSRSKDCDRSHSPTLRPRGQACGSKDRTRLAGTGRSETFGTTCAAPGVSRAAGQASTIIIFLTASRSSGHLFRLSSGPIERHARVRVVTDNVKNYVL